MSLQSISNPTKPLLGILEWFRPGEYEQVERVLASLKSINLTLPAL
ncbi:hypothetical protein [Coleofasciculus sp. G2-EDA-02]